MGCESCHKHDAEDAAKRNPVPRATHESDMDRADRANKRLFAALIVAIALFFASNALWLWAWMSYDYTGEETVVTQDGEGLNIYGDRNMTDFYGTDNPG